MTARRLRHFADLNLRVVNVPYDLAQVAHVEPFSAPWAFHEVVGLGFGDAVWIVALHDFAFGFRPSSAHLRATSSTLSARQRNCAASSIEAPPSIAALRSPISISVQSAPS